jgi:hypothetical protein
MLNIKESLLNQKRIKAKYKHVARPVTVFSSADSISFTFVPTFSIIPAPFS